MVTHARYVLTSLLMLVISGSIALAQANTPLPGRPAFSQQELDQMLAPIALYPDALLSQILMASTYPLEIVEAARWSRRNPGIDGERAVRAVERIAWDPSVKSLVAFPQVLAQMDKKLDWTERLGDAFLTHRVDVMDTVQYLREKAYVAGNLQSTDQLRINRYGQAIVIESTNPELIHVPYYNPLIVYGTWWWPSHNPVYWVSWPGYYARPGVLRGFAWGPGIHVSRNFFFGAPDWHRRSVTIVNVNNIYPSPVQVRPHTEIARVSPALAQVSPQKIATNLGARPNPPPALVTSNTPAAASQPDKRIAAGNPNVLATVSRPNVEMRPAIGDGVGHGASTRKSIERGLAGHQATAPAASTASASQPSGNAAAPTTSSSAAAPPPAGNPRGNGGTPRHQQ